MRRASVSLIALILALVVAPGMVTEAAIPNGGAAADGPVQSGPGTGPGTGPGSVRPPFRHTEADRSDTDGLSDRSDASRDPFFGLASACQPDPGPDFAETELAAFRDFVKFVGRQALIAKTDHDDINGTDTYEIALATYIWRIDRTSPAVPGASARGLHDKDLRESGPRRPEDHVSRVSGQTGFSGRLARDACDPGEIGPILASLFDNAGGFDIASTPGGPFVQGPGPRGGPGPRFGTPPSGPPPLFQPPTGGTPVIDPQPPVEVAPVPLPAGLVLLLSGLGALAGLSAWRRKAA